MAEYEDKGSQIRVKSLEAYPMGEKAYVKIETNMDVTGWGEINNMETAVTCELARSLGELIIDENPTRIEHHWQRLFRGTSQYSWWWLDGSHYLCHRYGIVGYRWKALGGSCVSPSWRSMP